MLFRFVRRTIDFSIHSFKLLYPLLPLLLFSLKGETVKDSNDQQPRGNPVPSSIRREIFLVKNREARSSQA